MKNMVKFLTISLLLVGCGTMSGPKKTPRNPIFYHQPAGYK